MDVSRRWIAAITGPWLALIVAEPPGMHLCAAHRASHIIARSGQQTGRPMPAHAAPHGLAESDHKAPETSPEKPPRCTCLGGFSHAGVFRLPETCEIVVPSVVILEPVKVTSEPPAVLPTAPSFLRPFSIGPPVLLAA